MSGYTYQNPVSRRGNSFSTEKTLEVAEPNDTSFNTDGGLKSACARCVIARTTSGFLLFAGIISFTAVVGDQFGSPADPYLYAKAHTGLRDGALVSIVHFQNLQLKRMSCTISCAICLVAFYYYKQMIAELEKPKSSTITVSVYRYLDWLVTLPMLGLEMNAIAKQRDTQHVAVPEGSTVETMRDAHILPDALKNTLIDGTYTALLLFGVIIMGMIVRFRTRESNKNTEETSKNRPKHFYKTKYIFPFITGCAYLIAAMGFIFNYFTDDKIYANKNWGWIISFVSPWAVYGVVFIFQECDLIFKCLDDENAVTDAYYDFMYSILDVWCKAVLAMYATYILLTHSDSLVTHNLTMYFSGTDDYTNGYGYEGEHELQGTD
jgi:bacteriorhodopsin